MLQEQLTEGLWNWYPYGKNVSIIQLHTEEELGNKQSQGECFDYVLISGLVERSIDPAGLLHCCKALLKPHGHLLIGAENRLGLSKFCGDRDPFTDRIFDGIEGYRNFTAKDTSLFGGRCYAKFELEEMLDKAGLSKRRFYSVLPNLLMPQQIYDEEYLPREELAIRYTPLYHFPGTVYLQEEQLYTSIIQNGMFHQMANAYLIDCSMDGNFPEILHVTTSMDRGAENAQATIIYKNKSVEKKALYLQGKAGIETLIENTQRLHDHGISVIPLQRNADETGVTMPYSETESALAYLRRLIYEDKEEFIRQTNRFLELILASSKSVDVQAQIPSTFQELGDVYEYVYLDMVPLNAFYDNGEFIFYDQEFCLRNYPIGVVLVRALDILYMNDKSMEAIVPERYFLDKYRLSHKLSALRAMGTSFINDLRKKDELTDFHQKHLVSVQQVFENRERMQYTRREYEKLFLKLEDGLAEKELYVFGSGLWARKFVAEFSGQYQVRAMLDNQKENWGKEVDGIAVASPDILRQRDVSKCKVIICVKYYTSIVAQLKKMGITDLGIYDPNIDRLVAYVGNDLKNENVACQDVFGTGGRGTADNESAAQKGQPNAKKKYHVGYVAGVFDLFHRGHLNLLRRAKEQCEYLIVGVVSDEQASKGKSRSPYVSQEDRREIVAACRYVDEAFILPFAASGTRDVYKRYHFDVQFSGSDYEHDPFWLSEQAWLRERGSDLVFFPYTQSVSSTKLKNEIDQKNTM